MKVKVLNQKIVLILKEDNKPMLHRDFVGWNKVDNMHIP